VTPSVLAERYEILRELGRGGMATVYLARDLRQGGEVAVKILSPELAPLLGAERFAREIRITASMEHPGILQVLDSGASDGHPFYVMPYVDGETLAQRLRREEQLPIDEALDIAGQLGRALAAAHARGFVHRDIKPSNILLARRDGDKVRALLADFGIARTIDVLTDEKLTESGVALGTASYMSPEQASGGRLDGRSDIYSLGCVLFEMLAGGPPFTGGSSQSIRARHVVDPVPSLRTVRQTVPPGLEAVIVKAMAKVPADRYHNAEQLVDALGRVDLTATATRFEPVRRRRWTLPVAALLLVLAGSGALAWRLMARGGPPVDPDRVMVFPLTTPSNPGTHQSTGEDISTIIGSALDGAGRLRWIDGWPLLPPRQREDIRNLSLEAARALALSKRCAWFVTGRLVARADSAEVFLELNDTRGDSVVARGRAAGLGSDDWRLGLHAVNDVLPALIPTGAPDVEAEWKTRDPAAVANYLLGEAAFRRVQVADALGHYRQAVRADSGFGLAAIRGAQAATWNHHASEAASLITVALRQPLSPRYRHFALGYAAYLEGRADSAAAELQRALAIDPEMVVAWIQLGEVYYHLLPEAGRVDTLAEQAFATAHRLDPRASNILLHLLERRLLLGDTTGAAPLVREFLAGLSDTTKLRAQVRVADRCVRSGPDSIAWDVEAARQPAAVLTAGQLLSVGGAQPRCAKAALASVVRADTTRDGNDRWFALLLLQGLWLAEGDSSDVLKAIEAAPSQDQAPRMFLLDAPLYPVLEARAATAAESYQRGCGPRYAECPNSYLVWQLAVWQAHAGERALSAATARELQRRADTATAPDFARSLGILARSAAAHAALARADTADAFAQFEAVLREPVPSDDRISWNIALPRAPDRLLFARLLAARREYRRAIAVADVFDSPSPAVYLLYVPASLRLRADAAAALGDRSLADAYRARLVALTGSPSSVAAAAGSTSTAGGTP
jgi:eukaryotic-like serine/threonine-protein kinase